MQPTVSLSNVLYPEMLRIIQHTIPAVNFTEFDREPSGHVNLIGRVKSVIYSEQSNIPLTRFLQESP